MLSVSVNGQPLGDANTGEPLTAIDVFEAAGASTAYAVVGAVSPFSSKLSVSVKATVRP